jgi:hypothetical protein
MTNLHLIEMDLIDKQLMPYEQREKEIEQRQLRKLLEEKIISGI